MTVWENKICELLTVSFESHNLVFFLYTCHYRHRHEGIKVVLAVALFASVTAATESLKFSECLSSEQPQCCHKSDFQSTLNILVSIHNIISCNVHTTGPF